jgi:hypothetical protein
MRAWWCGLLLLLWLPCGAWAEPPAPGVPQVAGADLFVVVDVPALLTPEAAQALGAPPQTLYLARAPKGLYLALAGVPFDTLPSVAPVAGLPTAQMKTHLVTRVLDDWFLAAETRPALMDAVAAWRAGQLHTPGALSAGDLLMAEVGAARYRLRSKASHAVLLATGEGADLAHFPTLIPQLIGALCAPDSAAAGLAKRPMKGPAPDGQGSRLSVDVGHPDGARHLISTFVLDHTAHLPVAQSRMIVEYTAAKLTEVGPSAPEQLSRLMRDTPDHAFRDTWGRPLVVTGGRFRADRSRPATVCTLGPDGQAQTPDDFCRTVELKPMVSP